MTCAVQLLILPLQIEITFVHSLLHSFHFPQITSPFSNNVSRYKTKKRYWKDVIREILNCFKSHSKRENIGHWVHECLPGSVAMRCTPLGLGIFFDNDRWGSVSLWLHHPLPHLNTLMFFLPPHQLLTTLLWYYIHNNQTLCIILRPMSTTNAQSTLSTLRG